MSKSRFVVRRKEVKWAIHDLKNHRNLESTFVTRREARNVARTMNFNEHARREQGHANPQPGP